MALTAAISARPGCIIAHQKAILDANRLGPEIVAFNLAEAEVAMLYSPSSLILNRAPYCRDVYDLYRDLAGSGHKIAFLSEKQLAEKKFRKVKVLVAGNVRNLPGATRRRDSKHSSAGAELCSSPAKASRRTNSAARSKAGSGRNASRRRTAGRC